MNTEQLKKEEENLYSNIRELIKGKQTSTVKSVIDRINTNLMNYSLIQ
jgi:hypothetical protein